MSGSFDLKIARRASRQLQPRQPTTDVEEARRFIVYERVESPELMASLSNPRPCQPDIEFQACHRRLVCLGGFECHLLACVDVLSPLQSACARELVVFPLLHAPQWGYLVMPSPRGELLFFKLTIYASLHKSSQPCGLCYWNGCRSSGALLFNSMAISLATILLPLLKTLFKIWNKMSIISQVR